jgi:hypothetical protein
MGYQQKTYTIRLPFSDIRLHKHGARIYVARLAMRHMVYPILAAVLLGFSANTKRSQWSCDTPKFPKSNVRGVNGAPVFDVVAPFPDI